MEEVDMGGSDEKAFPLRALVFASGSNNYTYKPNKSNKGIQRIGILLEREAFRNDNYGLLVCLCLLRIM